jgi:metal-responsive CopG/Arc/MetJ family transcriptional regulator
MRGRTKTLPINLQIAPSLLELVDKLAAQKFTSRSEFIRQALLHEIEREHGLRPVAA